MSQMHHDQLKELAQQIADEPDYDRALLLGRKLMTSVWAALPFSTRITFVSCLNHDGDLEYVKPFRPSQEAVIDAKVAEVLKRWPDVLGGLEGAERDFADDVEKRRRWKNWSPSEKQVNWILRIWSEHLINEPEMEVTE